VGAGATGDFALFCRAKDECAPRLDNSAAPSQIGHYAV
jgi:hypothetical protein